MKEIKNIIEIYRQLDETTTRGALATVVRADGSSYRRTGARMLVMENGVWVGGISGGCLEGDALKRARLAIANDRSSIVTYDTTEDDKHQIGVGLGCQGIIDVLFSPLKKGEVQNPIEILKTCVGESRQSHVLLSVLRTNASYFEPILGNMIRYQSVEDLNFIKDTPLIKTIDAAVNIQIESGKSAPRVFSLADGLSLELFIEILHPEIHVVMMGHQYDILPLLGVLKELGWKSTVVANPQKLLPKLFQLADVVVPLEKFETIEIDKYTAIILMSHDFKADKLNLPKALSTAAAYIGLLGPKTRYEKIIFELNTAGYKIEEKDLPRIHAPVGLDIGALSPEEIAISIAAEIRAEFSNRAGLSLRLRSAPIHERE